MVSFTIKARPPPLPLLGGLSQRTRLYVGGALMLLLSPRNVSCIAASGISLDLM